MPRRRPRRPRSTRRRAQRVDEHDCEIVVMFVDIMGASEISNHKSPKEYADFVTEFQEIFKDICKQYTQAWYVGEEKHYQYRARGDEGLLMIYRPAGSGGVVADIDMMIHNALELKRRWLCSSENKNRITKSGLLPVELGIGIHAGKAYLLDGGRKPEGYAINLAKRVEGHSRQGNFSHILLSESAHGRLNDLPDEKTYIFDAPQLISPKGISRDIRVYEIKHHFLPTDWKEASSRRRRSQSLILPYTVDLETIEGALSINPTNLWLAEEFIRSSMLQGFHGLSAKERENFDKLAQVFQPAATRAAQLTHSEQRDAGALFIQGLVEGECGRFASEQEKYEAAVKDTDHLAEAYWYKALSLSWEVYEEYGLRKIGRDALPNDFARKVEEALKLYQEARTRRPNSAWIHYDLGCEMVRWPDSEDDVNEGVRQVAVAATMLDSVRDAIEDEPYLERVQDNQMIKTRRSSVEPSENVG